MQILLRIITMVLQTLGLLLFDILFWILIIIVIFLYKKSSSIEKTMLGETQPLKEKIIGSVMNGLIGGLIGSFFVVLLGITIQEYLPQGVATASSGILYIWIVAILLSMINPRYLCFSYSGGIVSLVHLFTGFPEINVPGILALVGILHLVESFLIWLDGYSNASPVFIKRKDNNIVGGFIMNRFWPIPMVILIAALSTTVGGGGVNMPDWWPIIKHTGKLMNSENLMYLLAPIPVVLGYGDMAITCTPEKRCKISAVRLSIFSIILIVLSAISSRIYVFQYIAALFSPLGHEYLILLGKNEEEKGKPLFDASSKGLKVLYSLKNSPAYYMNIQPGDIILKINNTDIDNEVQLAEFLKERPSYIWIELLQQNGQKRLAEYKNYQTGIGSLGSLVIPKNTDIFFEINDKDSLLKRIIDKFKVKPH